MDRSLAGKPEGDRFEKRPPMMVSNMVARTGVSSYLFAHGCEVNCAGVVEVFARESRFRLKERAQVDDLVDNVARVAATHHALTGAILRFDQVVDRFFVVRNAGALAVLQEDPLELVFSWAGDVDLVWDPAQERFVDQVRWVQVCGEHQQLFKWNFEFFTGV